MTATNRWVMAVADVAKRTRLMWLGPKGEEADTRKNKYRKLRRGLAKPDKSLLRTSKFSVVRKKMSQQTRSDWCAKARLVPGHEHFCLTNLVHYLISWPKTQFRCANVELM
jgi:hypothetical protein